VVVNVPLVETCPTEISDKLACQNSAAASALQL
jgi:hypothetical protein